MLLTEIKQKKFKQKSNKNHDFRPKRESKLKAEHRSIYILSPSKPVNRLLRTKRSTQTHSLNNWILLTLWFIDSVAEYHVQQTINIVINIKLLCDIRFFQFFFFLVQSSTYLKRSFFCFKLFVSSFYTFCDVSDESMCKIQFLHGMQFLWAIKLHKTAIISWKLWNTVNWPFINISISNEKVIHRNYKKLKIFCVHLTLFSHDALTDWKNIAETNFYCNRSLDKRWLIGC